MRTRNLNRTTEALSRQTRSRPSGAALLAVALLASACTTTGAQVPARVEKQPGGFTIEEQARFGLGDRSDFAEALELLREKAYPKAIALLVELTESSLQLTAAHINLGIAYRETDEFEKAQASLERAVALNPRHPAAHNELGIVHRRRGQFDEARASYEEALDLFPEYHYARRNLAILCDLFLADLACALEHYEIYVEAVPDDAEAAIWVADLRNRAGR